MSDRFSMPDLKPTVWTTDIVQDEIEHADQHNQLAEKLLVAEVIYSEDLEAIFGKRPWVSRSQEIIDQQNASMPDPPPIPKPEKNTKTEVGS